MDAKSPADLCGLIAGSAGIFKKIFPRVFIIYALFGAVPAALLNAYTKPGRLQHPSSATLLASIPLTVLSLLISFIVFFYILAEVKKEPISLSRCFKEIGKAVWPVITTFIMEMLLIIGGAVAAGIVAVLLTGLLSFPFALLHLEKTYMTKMLATACVFLPVLLVCFYFWIRLYFSMKFAFMDKTEWFTPFKQSWLLTKNYFGDILIVILIILAYGLVFFNIKIYTGPVVSAVLILVLSPLSFFMQIVLNLLFFNLYYGQKQ